MAAAGSVEISGQQVADRDPEDLGERQRSDREVRAAQPERDEANGDAGQRGDRRPRSPSRRGRARLPPRDCASPGRRARRRRRDRGSPGPRGPPMTFQLWARATTRKNTTPRFSQSSRATSQRARAQGASARTAADAAARPSPTRRRAGRSRPPEQALGTGHQDAEEEEQPDHLAVGAPEHHGAQPPRPRRARCRPRRCRTRSRARPARSRSAP